jgi:hypothetical protein
VKKIRVALDSLAKKKGIGVFGWIRFLRWAIVIITNHNYRYQEY